MPRRNFAYVIASALCVLTGSAAAVSQGAVLYDLSTVVRDGTTGENTYHVRNNASPVGSLTYNGTNDTLTWVPNAPSNYAYVVGYYNATTLANVGDSIVLSYAAIVSGNAFGTADSIFRTALINSGGTRTADDVTGTGGTAFSTDTGYAAYYRAANGTNGAGNTLYQRTSANQVLFGSNPGFTVLAGAPQMPIIGTSNVTGTFSLTRVATGVRIESTVNGGATQSFVDTAGLDTTFDGFGFFLTAGTGSSSLTFTTLSVTTAAAVPEPAALGLASVAAGALLRHRHRRSGGR